MSINLTKRSLQLLRTQNRSSKQLSSASNSSIANLPLKAAKNKLTCEINNAKPCQPIETPPNEPNWNKVEENSSKIVLGKTPSERSLSTEAAKVVPNIKLPMDNSKVLKRPASINHQRATSFVTNNNKLSAKSIQSTKSNRPTQSAQSNKSTSRSAASTSLAAWQSPFKTFITTGVRTRKRLYGCPESHEFSYDLSREELKCLGTFAGPMKPAPEQERQILTNGQRVEYLTQRYEHSPHYKYNYPEATSWRIGWLQHQQQHPTKHLVTKY